jgi:hypothetical protein
MISILSLVTSVKDYVEIIHKLIETDSNFKISNYSDLGPVITYIIITLKEFFFDIISLNWLKTIWDLPIIIPDINSAMISEISVLDGYFHNAFNFLDKPISYGQTNIAIYSLEKFSVGLINSLFLCIPTGTTHLITIRRFLMQGLEAGYLAGLGSICGNILWISSIIFGWRFFVIPWLSLDIFRYLLGFVLLVKYMWDSYGDSQKKIGQPLTTTSAKQKIFLLNFLLALTEQTSLYPFISNISIGSESSLLESFPAQNYLEFLSIHGSYILGLVIGCFSLLHFTCWFWENPAFKIYMWVISSFKISTTFYYKVLNFSFLYLTMICAISSIPYYGLDYTLTNPLGFVQDDRILDQKLILETSFLNTKASDRNTRRNRGRHGRRERWKRRIRKYRTFDASLYDQGIYDLFTIEDLNYGFDRFWLRRKMRNHRVRFRFFPGPWMRSFKKQLAKPRLESYAGPRQEFFRILFEQVYHPSFHEYTTQNVASQGVVLTQEKINDNASVSKMAILSSTGTLTPEGFLLSGGPPASSGTRMHYPFGGNASLFSFLPKKEFSIYSTGDRYTYDEFLSNQKIGSKQELTASQGTAPQKRWSALPVVPTIGFSAQSSEKQATIMRGQNRSIVKTKFNIQDNLKIENSTLRKFVRKINSRLKNSEIKGSFKVEGGTNKEIYMINDKPSKTNYLYSKRWKEIFSKIYHNKEQLAGDYSNGQLKGLFKNFYQNSLGGRQNKQVMFDKENNSATVSSTNKFFGRFQGKVKKENSKISLSKQDKQTLKYRSILASELPKNSAVFFSESSAKKGMTLLHPLKFYLKKQEAFERKLRYYTPTIFRKFSIENNAPYFRVMMKRYFYYFKPTLRWERTMKVASLRKARRKTPVSARKIQFSNGSDFAQKQTIGFSEQSSEKQMSIMQGLSNTTVSQNLLSSLEKNQDSFKGSKLSGQQIDNITTLLKGRQDRKVKATHNYTIVGKRASRFRYEIYKDVLQHWYYSPFNRLLLKFDIDLFIKRQPNSHFLTKNEEKLLHLRRFLLSEHYNTLRWYSYMQHYRSMKTKIGGTKSFASKVYNQQFSGTFKKIRHLFAITPSQSNQSVLKFDQPLYNESFNNEPAPFSLLTAHPPASDPLFLPNKKTLKVGGGRVWAFSRMQPPPPQGGREEGAANQQNRMQGLSKNSGSKSLQKNLIIHEELLNDGQPREYKGLFKPNLIGTDLLNQSTEIVGTYLRNSNPIKQEYIKNLIEDKNYLKLTEFLYKGQKTRGSKPITNERSLLNQEKEYLLTNIEKQEFNNLEKIKLNKMLRTGGLQQDLWVNLLKRWKRKINDQEFLKNYLQRRIEKREKRKQKKEINLKAKLERLETWSVNKEIITDNSRVFNNNILKSSFFSQLNSAELTTGVNKALTEGISTLQSPKESFKELSIYSKENRHLHIDRSILKNASFLKKEKDVAYSLNNFTKIIKELNQSNSKKSITNKNDGPLFLSAPPPPAGILLGARKEGPAWSDFGQNLTMQGQDFLKKRSSLKILILNISTKIKNISSLIKFKERKRLSKLILSSTRKLVNIFKPITRRNKNLKNWQQRERSLNKQKRSRKEFKLFSKKPFQNTSVATVSSNNNYLKFLNDLDSKTGVSLQRVERKKRDFSNNSQNNLSQAVKENLIIKGGSEATSKNESNWKNKIKDTYIKYFWQPSKFKRKKSPQRRARVRRNRGVTKKRTLSDSLKREFKNLRKYAADSSVDNLAAASSSENSLLGMSVQPEALKLTKYSEKIDGKKQKIYLSFRNAAGLPRVLTGNLSPAKLSDKTATLTSENINAGAYDGIFKQSPLQRRSKQKKQRFWKQKRSKYSQKLRKYKKRRRSVLGKVRILNKQLKRIQSTTELKNWWWKNFLPNLRATTDSLLQFEKDRQIQQKLLELSIPEILERDKFWQPRFRNNLTSDMLQIGDYDFKPLSMPEAIKLREKNINLTNQSISNTQQLNSNQDSHKIVELPSQNALNLEQLSSRDSFSFYVLPKSTAPETKDDIISKISQASLNPVSISSIPFEKLTPNTPLWEDFGGEKRKKIFSTNIVPFYAGWDESLRKFVVTNRLLSRRSSGFEMRSDSYLPPMNIGGFPNSDIISEGLSKKVFTKNPDELLTDNFKLFSEAPLKGMNAATTLYWQIPFTTYDPDQFFALGMDGFAPLGWRRFQFRHSILKSWIMNRGKSESRQKSSLFKNSHPSPSAGSGGPPEEKGAGGAARMQGVEVTSTIATVSSKNNFVDSSANSSERENKVITISKTKTNILNRIYNQNNSFSLRQSPLGEDLAASDKMGVSMQGISEPHGPTGIKLSRVLPFGNEKNGNVKNIYRRLKKRYKRVKKHPRSPVWFPSGPLLNQVLPVHYIYIFYKRSRLPRDRYIKRRLRRVFPKNISQDAKNSMGNIIGMKDFTLRKRIKTKRKYHIKQDLNKNTTIIPRRMKFFGLPPSTSIIGTKADYPLWGGGAETDLTMRWRPLSRQKINKPISELIKEQRALKYKQRKKDEASVSGNNKQTPNLRVKQLRRRVQRQIIRSVWRYRPRAGGFVWPGDYLKLEQVKAPKLNSSLLRGRLNKQQDTSNIDVKTASQTLKVKRKKKRNIQEWQIQPKKYLLEKHNLNAIKKKLEKANRSNKIRERVKELNLTL